MNYCILCGKPIKEDYEFCYHCTIIKTKNRFDRFIDPFNTIDSIREFGIPSI